MTHFHGVEKYLFENTLVVVAGEIPYISKANKNICMNVSESYFDLQYHHSVNRDKQYSITAM